MRPIREFEAYYKAQLLTIDQMIDRLNQLRAKGYGDCKMEVSGDYDIVDYPATVDEQRRVVTFAGRP